MASLPHAISEQFGQVRAAPSTATANPKTRPQLVSSTRRHSTNEGTAKTWPGRNDLPTKGNPADRAAQTTRWNAPHHWQFANTPLFDRKSLNS